MKNNITDVVGKNRIPDDQQSRSIIQPDNYGYCGKRHVGECYLKTGAYFICAQTCHFRHECLRKKNLAPTTLQDEDAENKIKQMDRSMQ